MDLNEKCGVIGIYGTESDVSRLAYYGLWTLQHRGQENSGIACSNGKRVLIHKGKGLVAHVYTESDIKRLTGYIAIGHNRYSTFGKSNVDHSQPVFHNSLALVHNGNLPRVNKLKRFLTTNGISSEGLNDSEMMHAAIKYWYIKGKSIQDSIINCYPLFTGAFSALVMDKKTLVAIRDPFGIRPLSIGKVNGTYIFSSETCTFDTLGATFVRDVNPGEMVWVDSTGLHSEILAKGTINLDVFEFIYFARPDSMLMGKSIYEVRKNLGIQLAKESKIKADIVIAVPDSGIPSAIGYSEYSGIPLELSLIKNRYIHRTFIKPAQKQRHSGVSMKLNLIPHTVKGKRVIIIDDSIVRGTTSKKLAELV
ncbi:MAG: Amidophosphoribosyltransferase, partial [Patescibacteria group bacterium]|nr:Amidophosphoribosyltransferase [Patescibacteria group bacterium]